MATLIIIEDRPNGRGSSLAREYFPSDDEALDRALDFLSADVFRFTLRIECDDDQSVMDDATVRRLAPMSWEVRSTKSLRWLRRASAMEPLADGSPNTQVQSVNINRDRSARSRP